MREFFSRLIIGGCFCIIMIPALLNGRIIPFSAGAAIPPALWWGFGITIGALCLAIGINLMLRRRVRLKTIALRTQNNLLEKEIAARKKIEKRLKSQKLHLVALHETALGIIAHMPLNNLLKNILDKAATLVEAEHGMIYLLDARRDCLSLKAYSGKIHCRLGQVRHRGKGLTGQVWATGKPVKVDDYPNWSRRIDDPALDIIRSMIGVPLIFEQKVIGVMALGRCESHHPFDRDDMETLHYFAEQAAISLSNAKLYERLKQELKSKKAVELKLRKSMERLRLNLDELEKAEADKNTLEVQLHQNHRMQAIGTLAGGIAHDFNNILTPIIGYAEMLMIRTHLSPDDRHRLNEIEKAGHRAKDLIQQILTFSRQEHQGQIKFDVRPAIREALRLIQASIPSTITLETDIPGESLVIRGNPTQLHQIIMNLCTNAYHAMRKNGGVLKVSLKRIRVESGSIGGYPFCAGEYVRLRVKDTGCGMSPDTLERIFEPYFTTKNMGEGSGLGLSVVHGIVKNAKGHIEAESRPGKGSVFTLLFPCCKTGGEVCLLAPEAQNIDAHFLKDLRILMVDDEEIVLSVQQQLITCWGGSATAFNSSKEALQTFKASPRSYDLVITDMTMPHFTGAELAKEILAIRPHLPVIICSGYKDTLMEEQASRMGVREYLTKPVAGEELKAAIRRAVSCN